MGHARSSLRPTALLWGLLVQGVLALGLAVVGLGGLLVAGRSLGEIEGLMNREAALWIGTGLNVVIGCVVGAVIGWKARRLEVLHATLFVALTTILDLALSAMASKPSMLDEIGSVPWHSYLLIPSTLLGSLLVQLRRVQSESRLRARGFWWCAQCGFEGTPSDLQCSRCGAQRQRNAG